MHRQIRPWAFQTAMLTLSIWLCAILLEVLLLFQGFRKQLVCKYPVFYSYILYVLLQSLVRYFVRHEWPGLYPTVYWTTQFPAVIVGCVVVFDIFQMVLAEYPGTARLARNVLLFVFAMAVAKALVNVSNGASLFGQTQIELERNLRVVQIVAIFGIAVLSFFYAIPFGKNARGIVVGYGLYLSTSVIQLTWVSHFGERSYRIWLYTQPAIYLFALAVWIASLWSYEPVPAADPHSMLERDYQRLADATLARFRQVRVLFGRSTRL